MLDTLRSMQQPRVLQSFPCHRREAHEVGHTRLEETSRVRQIDGVGSGGPGTAAFTAKSARTVSDA